jgi:hypothetical protein
MDSHRQICNREALIKELDNRIHLIIIWEEEDKCHQIKISLRIWLEDKDR